MLTVTDDVTPSLVQFSFSKVLQRFKYGTVQDEQLLFLKREGFFLCMPFMVSAFSYCRFSESTLVKLR